MNLPIIQLDLLRHGATEQGHTLRGHIDDALTAEGLAQMQASIDTHSNQNWHVIVSSPLLRCAYFAAPLAQRLACPYIEVEALKEMYFGEWEGKTTRLIYEQSPEELANFWQCPTQYSAPQGERLIDFQTRVLNALKKLIELMSMRHQSHALVVTHGGVIKLLRCLAQQRPLDELLTMQAPLGELVTLQLSTQDDQLMIQEMYQ